ncbi:MAG: hypothetical protein MRY79_00160, partial [Alphaproteobacteria bacterium]|nr:hypothetical protein [Alphaproteobacteria bacterium]
MSDLSARKLSGIKITSDTAEVQKANVASEQNQPEPIKSKKMDETASKLAAVTAQKTVAEKITAEKKAANISVSSPALSATSATARATQNKSQSSLKVGMSSQRLESFSTPEDSKPH